PRGLVSGMTSAMPSSAAMRCAPALVVKFSSLQVKPDSQNRTGGLTPSLAGGRKMLNVMAQFRTVESCRQRCCRPSKQRCSSSSSMQGSSVRFAIHKTHNTEFSFTCEQLSLSQGGEMLHHKLTFI